MSLDLNAVPSNNVSKSNRPLPKVGPHPSRVAQIIDLGIQPRAPFKGKEKSPVHQVFVNFELADDSYEVEGKQVKHRIGGKPLNVVSRSSEMYDNSAIAKLLKAIDPQDTIKGSLPALANRPCLAIISHTAGIGKHAGKTFANLTQVSMVPDGYPVPELSSTPTVFSFDEPTEDAWKAIPEFLQNKIKTALNYKGSKVEAMVSKMVTA